MEELGRADLPHESYVVVDDVHSAESEIFPGEFQLLVMGTVNGDADAAETFARRMRQKSERLIVASFSVVAEFPEGDPFHFSILKDFCGEEGHMCDDLLKAMRNFLALREQRKSGG